MVWQIEEFMTFLDGLFDRMDLERAGDAAGLTRTLGAETQGVVAQDVWFASGTAAVAESDVANAAVPGPCWSRSGVEWSCGSVALCQLVPREGAGRKENAEKPRVRRCAMLSTLHTRAFQ